MRRKVVTTETRCDMCDRVIPAHGLHLEAGPLDFDMECASMGVCEGCGSLTTFPHESLVVGGNCLACFRRAMDLPRGVCDRNPSAPHALGKCPIGFPKRWHHCRELPGHPGHHECLCGAEWGGGL
jgi:hypothetical protein